MRPSVLAAFWNFTVRLEGYDDEPYCDILGLVTVSVGCLVDPLSLALGLPWLHRADDSPATTAEISAVWDAIKVADLPSRRLVPGDPPRQPCTLYLTPEACASLVTTRLRQNEVYLARRWSNWASWPADAQLGAHSCAWAAGALWRAPHFDAEAATLDFASIAGPDGDANADFACRGDSWLCDSPVGYQNASITTNPGLRRRNLQNKLLFTNAARVLKAGTDPDVLHWPASVSAP